jgi:hypothetical protein
MNEAVDNATTKMPAIFVPLDDGGALYVITADRVIPLSELSVAERRRLSPYLRAIERGWWPRIVR